MFAQKVYSQKLGNSNYTISQAGCLLVSICNLLEKLNGTAPDPPTLDLWYVSHGDFIYDKADNASDDLAANSISKYDPTIVNTASGSSAVPSSNIAIVRFNYNSVETGLPISHYCAVDHIDGSGVWIIDSWDGLVKGPSQYESVYHLPVAWFTYVKNNPAPVGPPYTLQHIATKQVKLNKDTYRFNLTYGNAADIQAHPLSPAKAGSIFPTSTIVNHQDGQTYYSEDNSGFAMANGFLVADCDDYTPPVPTPPAAPVTVPYAGQGTAYPVVVPLKGYKSATQAGNQANAGYDWVEPESYVVYRYYDNTKALVNITKNKTVAGWWIKDSLNKTPEPVLSTDWPSQTASVPVTVTSPAVESASSDGPNSYKTTYSTFKDNHGNPQPLYYVAQHDLPVTNFDTGKILTIKQYVTVQISGTFMKDSLKYARPTDAANQGLWYGIAMMDDIGNPNLLLEDNGQLSTTERIATGRKMTIQDYMTRGIYTIEKVMDVFFNKTKKG